MKIRFRKLEELAAAALGLACLGASAQPTNVTFFDGGYAELCSQAAHNLENSQNVVLTGSRIDIPPFDLCTMAVKGVGVDGIPGNVAVSYVNRGVVLFSQGLLDEAMNDFDNAIRLDETLAQAHVNRGYILMRQERWADSIAAFDRGIAFNTSELAKVHYNRGIAHEELGNVREAYLDYLKASELQPEWEEPKQELTRFTVRRE